MGFSQPCGAARACIFNMEIFQIDENLFQSSMIDDVERVKMFDVCIDLAGGIDPDAGDLKIYLKWTIEDAELPDLFFQWYMLQRS